MVLTASMYEETASFGSSDEERELDDGVVAPPPYPPPVQASVISSSSSSTNPPVRIVEAAAAEWQSMLIVDEDLANDDGGVIMIENDYELVQGGTLIVDGESEENNNTSDDASLTLPDSDNMPSDPGTIDHDGNNNNNNNENNGNWEHLDSDDDDDEEEEDSRRRRLLRHGRNLYNATLRPLVARLFPNHHHHEEENCYYDLQWGEFSSITTRHSAAGFSLLMIALALLCVPLVSYIRLIRSARSHEERWKFLQEENLRLQVQEEQLKVKMQLLQEEAAAAMAKATSLSREHEKWKLLHGATGGEKDFFFDDEDFAEDCDKDSFTVLDNCWLKAKGSVHLGDCGDNTKDFFKNLWDNLWSPEFWGGDALHNEWEYYDYASHFDADAEDQFAMEPYSTCDENNGENCQEEEEENVDPLAAVFTAITSAGQSFSNKLSELMHEEAANTRKSAAELETTIHKGFSQASVAISRAMEDVKTDMHALSQEVLTTLNAAVPRKGSKEEPKAEQPEQENPQTVTRKGLFDAANALSSLSKTWNEAVASVVSTEVVPEPVPEKEEEAWWKGWW